MSKKSDPGKIAVIRTDRIGEVLLSTVLVPAIKLVYPEAEIFFVTSEYARPLVEDMELVKEVLTFNTPYKKGWVREAGRLAGDLRRRRIDTAIVLNPHKALHLACFLAGIPVRAGYDRKWGFLLNRRIRDERDKGLKHECEYAMDLSRAIGIDWSVPEVRLGVNEAAGERAARLLADKMDGAGHALVAVHPGSSNISKIWPRERYAELIRRIKDESVAEVVLLGGAGEKRLTEEIARESGVRTVDLAGELDLKELAAVLARVDIFVGNDAGPMHMAAAVGTPVVAIFGRNIPGVGPKRWGPWGEGHVVFHETPGCEPCLDSGCNKDHRCLKNITVDQVFEAVKEKLGK
jgi:lipopolysaccharide heptosyltransferase II